LADEAATEELNIGLLLYIRYRAMETRVFTELAAAGYDDVTPAQAQVFQRIGRDGTRLTDLAEQAQVAKQTSGVLVDQLAAPATSNACPTPPTHEPGWSASPSMPSPRFRSRRRSSTRSKLSGPNTWASGA
jgi:hypothetical protein